MRAKVQGGMVFIPGTRHRLHRLLGEKTLLVALKTPKPLPPYKRGRGGLGPGSLCELCPEGRKKEGRDTGRIRQEGRRHSTVLCRSSLDNEEVINGRLGLQHVSQCSRYEKPRLCIPL